jgi:hypothetical protein
MIRNIPIKYSDDLKSVKNLKENSIVYTYPSIMRRVEIEDTLLLILYILYIFYYFMKNLKVRLGTFLSRKRYVNLILPNFRELVKLKDMLEIIKVRRNHLSLLFWIIWSIWKYLR